MSRNIVRLPKNVDELVAYGGGDAKNPTGVNVVTPAIPEDVPDSIFTTSYAQAIDLICEGPIEAIHTVYFDETPIDEDADTVQIMKRLGIQDQEEPMGIPGIQNLVDVGSVEITAKGGEIYRSIDNPDIEEIGVTIRIGGLFKENDEGVAGEAGVRGWMRLITEDGAGTEVANEVWGITGKTTSGQVTLTFNLTVPDGLDPVADYPLRLAVGKKVRDRKSGGNNRNDVYWKYYNEIIWEHLNYPNTAYVGTEISAQRYTVIPNRAYDCSGLVISCPANRDNDPESGTYRQYGGDWNGTFVQAWTDNPAWVLWALLTNERWGMGHLLSPADVDKWALYEIGKYCDELVDDGQGGTEPRFKMFSYIEEPRDIYEYIQSICQIFHGFPIWAGTQISFALDRELDPIAQFNQTNVKDGVFVYESTAHDDRFTVVSARWNDPAHFYMPAYAIVESKTGIARYGERPSKVTAFGCTSEGQATRFGRKHLYDSNYETDVVNFVTGLEGAALVPGDNILIQDPVRSEFRLGGRIADLGTNQIKLDQETTIESGKVYTLTLMAQNVERTVSKPNNATDLGGLWGMVPPNLDHRHCTVWADVNGNGTFETECETTDWDGTLHIVSLGGGGSSINYRIIMSLGLVELSVTNGAGTTDIITFSESLALYNDILPTTWILSPAADDSTAVKYRVTGVEEKEPNEFAIQATKVYSAKYAAIESNLAIEEPPSEFIPPDASLLPVVNITVTPEVQVVAGGNRQLNLAIEWADDPATSPSSRSFRVAYQFNGGDLISLATDLRDYTTKIENAKLGQYTIYVWAKNVLGQESASNWFDYLLNQVLPVHVMPITGLEQVGQGADGIFEGSDIELIWRIQAFGDPEVDLGDDLPDDDEDLSQDPERFTDDPAQNPFIKDFWVEIYNESGELIHEEARTIGQYFLSYAKNAQYNGGDAARLVRFRVYARDWSNTKGPAAYLQCENPAPPQLDGTRLRGTFRGVLFEWVRPADNDFVGIIAWMSTSATFTPGEENEVYRGLDSPAFLQLATLDIKDGSTVYVKVAAYDRFGDDPDTLNISPAIACQTYQVIVDPDDLPDGFVEMRHLGLAIINEGHMMEAIIGNAYIKDLAVDTFKLAGNAVSFTDEVTLDEVAYDFFPTHGQGGWTAIQIPSTGAFVEVELTTLGGSVELLGDIDVELILIDPTLSSMEGVAGTETVRRNIYGQFLPKLRYRLVRSPGDVIVYSSNEENVEFLGYRHFTTAPRIDNPPAGTWRYRLELQWMEDKYDHGTCTCAASSPWALTGTDTRWMENVQYNDTFQYLDIGNGQPGPVVNVNTLTFDWRIRVDADPRGGGTPTGEYVIRRTATSYRNSYVYTGPSDIILDIHGAYLRGKEMRA